MNNMTSTGASVDMLVGSLAKVSITEMKKAKSNQQQSISSRRVRPSISLLLNIAGNLQCRTWASCGLNASRGSEHCINIHNVVKLNFADDDNGGVDIALEHDVEVGGWVTIIVTKENDAQGMINIDVHHKLTVPMELMNDVVQWAEMDEDVLDLVKKMKVADIGYHMQEFSVEKVAMHSGSLKLIVETSWREVA